MGIGIQRQGNIYMAEALLNHFRIDSLLEHQSRRLVPKIVKANIWQVGLFENRLKVLVHIAVIQRRSHNGWKDQVIFFPVLPGLLPFTLLELDLFLKFFHDHFSKHDHSLPCSRFWFCKNHAPFYTLQLSFHL